MQEEPQQDVNQQEAAWVFDPGAQAPASNTQVLAQTPDRYDARISWSASEYIAHPKNIGWFMSLGLATVLLTVVVYLVTKDVISTAVITVIGIIVGVFAARQPRTLDYALDSSGLHLGPRFYPYGSFKSFSIVQEEAFSHISLLPLKRFMPPLVVHYPPENEESVVDTLADYLPYEEHKPDMIDNFSKRVRF